MSTKSVPTKTVKGHYNGKVVVLEEPAPTAHAVAVTVEFPAPPKEHSAKNAEYHWAPATDSQVEDSVGDELIRQRHQQ